MQSPANTPQRVALIGDAFVDVQINGVSSIPAWGGCSECSGVQILPGGSCCNVGRQLASISGGELEALFFSTVGDDDMGRFYTRALAGEGLLAELEHTLCVRAGVPQSTCVILAGQSDRAMIDAPGSNSCVSIESTGVGEAAEQQGGAQPWVLLHIGGYFNCVGLHTEQTLELVRAARARGTLVSVDTQFDTTGAWTGVDGHLARLLPLCDVFLPNEVEAAAISGAVTAPDALDALTATFPALLVVLKHGARGLLAGRGAERWSAPALQARFVDATGAGDAADAGFLLQYLRDRADVPAALRSANAAGACAVAAAGGCVRPVAREEYLALVSAATEK